MLNIDIHVTDSIQTDQILEIQIDRLTDESIGTITTTKTITLQQLMLALLVQQNRSQHLQYHGSNLACMRSLF